LSSGLHQSSTQRSYLFRQERAGEEILAAVFT
jgi:hypothetical protein